MSRSPLYRRVLAEVFGTSQAPVPAQSRPGGLHLERAATAPDVGRWEPKPETPTVPAYLRRPLLEDGPITQRLRHELGELTADRNRLDTANGVLLARINRLTAQVRDLTTQLDKEGADRG